MGEAAAHLFSVDEFLAWDDGTDRRYQLLRGVVTLMAPAQAAHGALVIRLGSALSAKLPKSCTALGEAGIRPPHRSDTFYVADLAVTCRPLERGEVMLAEPILIVEVLSPSTAATDRMLKLDDYLLIPSVTDILFVSTAEMRVDHWHRQGDAWLVALRRSGEQVELATFGIVLSLDELYADLPIGEIVSPTPPIVAPGRD